MPSLVLVRRQTGGDLKSGGRGSSRDTRVLYQTLIVAEVALACVLLVSSALLVRTVGEMRVPIGVTGESIVLAEVQLAMSQGPGAWATLGRQHAEILERVREQPGVVSAGSTNILPMEPGWRSAFDAADRTYGRPEDRPQVQYHSISEGYFETMGATLIDGRAFGVTCPKAKPSSSSTRPWRSDTSLWEDRLRSRTAEPGLLMTTLTAFGGAGRLPRRIRRLWLVLLFGRPARAGAGDSPGTWGASGGARRGRRPPQRDAGCGRPDPLGTILS